MKKSLIIAALFAASFSLATGQLIEGKYEVALNEVEHQLSDGGVAKPMSFQKQKSVAALINFVDYLSQATGEHCALGGSKEFQQLRRRRCGMDRSSRLDQ